MSASSSPLRLAFIGSGGITNAHAQVIENFPELFEVVATCDVHLPNAEKLAARFGEKIPSFGTMEDLLTQVGGQLHAVIICTPHFLHFPAAEFFLQRGIPVLIEKPAVCHLDEWTRLRDLETDRAFVQAGNMQRFDAQSLWLRDYVQDAETFGSPRSFDLNIWQNIQGYIGGNEQHWILDGKKAGGGICISVGIHPLDLLRFVTGQDFTEVNARGRFDPPFTNQAESSCSALFEMSGGITGTLHASYQPSRVPYAQRLVLYGERGGIYQHPEMGNYAGPYLTHSADPNITTFREMFATYEPIEEQAKKAYPEGASGGFQGQLLHFREAVLAQHKPQQNSLDINHNTIAVLDAIAESLLSGKTVPVAQL